MHQNKPVYLDFQGSTPLAKEVIDAMLPYFEGLHVNPHSSSLEAQYAMGAINNARCQVASLIECAPDELFFTSGATESNNTAIQGVMLANIVREWPSNVAKCSQWIGRDTILLSSIEHSSVSAAVEVLAKHYGFTVKTIPVNKDGFVDIEAYADRLTDRVLLVSVMAVNNEIGTIQNLKKISQFARDHGALVHCDAAQMPLACEISVEDLGVDFLSLSGHKMYGPKGIGALFVSAAAQQYFRPLIHGGGQQDGMRAGTLPTPLCVGVGRAAKLVLENGKQLRAHAFEMRELFIERLRNNGVNFSINGCMQQRHPGNLNICFQGVDASHVLMLLGDKISASQGSACSSGMIRPSKVLTALGLSDKDAQSSVRFGFGLQTVSEDVLRAADHLSDAIAQMRIVDPA